MIIPFHEDLIEEVAALEERDGDAHWTRAHFEKELESEFVRFFVIQEEKTIIGYAGYWKAGPEAQITNIVVRTENRCQGNAQRLLEFLFDCARSEACESMTLEVRAGNAHARALYAKMGFQEIARRKQFYKDPIDDAVIMEKQL